MGTRVDIALRWLEHGRGLDLPRQQTAGAAGVDLPAALGPDQVLELPPGGSALVPTGFCIALPEGYEAQVRPRSPWMRALGRPVSRASSWLPRYCAVGRVTSNSSANGSRRHSSSMKQPEHYI